MLGDRPLNEYSSSDSAMYRNYLLKKVLNTASVKRNFSTIRSINNLTIQEHGLDCRNAFSNAYLPDLDDVPHIDLKPHPCRCLKTKGKKRKTPLAGASLWAAQHIKADTNDSLYAFPR